MSALAEQIDVLLGQHSAAGSGCIVLTSCQRGMLDGAWRNSCPRVA